MDRRAALELLPEAYALALRLRDAGAEPRLIAVALDADESAIPTVLRVAEAKLAALLHPPSGPVLAAGPGLNDEEEDT